MNSRYLMAGTIVCCIVLVILLSYLGASEESRLELAQKQYRGTVIENGARLYNLHCRACHGPRGEGVGQLGPPLNEAHFFQNRLSEVGWLSTLENYIAATTEHGRMMGTRPIYAGNGSTAVMAPWLQEYGGPLRGDEISALTSFIMNWRPTALGEVSLAELPFPRFNPGNPAVIERGAEVFLVKCGHCHRFRNQGEQEVPGPDLSDIAATAASRKDGVDGVAYIRESVLVPEAYVVDGWGEMDGSERCGELLTESELAAVVRFLLN